VIAGGSEDDRPVTLCGAVVHDVIVATAIAIATWIHGRRHAVKATPFGGRADGDTPRRCIAFPA